MKGQFGFSTITLFYILPLISLALLIINSIASEFNIITSFAMLIIVVSIGVTYAFFSKLKKTFAEKNIQAHHLLTSKVFNDGKEDSANQEIISMLEKRLDQSIDFITAIGRGDLDASFPDLTSDIYELNEGNIVGEIHSMHQKMQKIAVSEHQRNWATEGIAKFSEIFRQQDKPISEILDIFLIEFCRYIKANQATVFVANNKNDTSILELASTYAFNRKKFLTKEIAPGEGLIGQVYLEKESIYLKELPSDYVNITSGLGEANPTVVYIAPLKFNEKVEGVIEIASFENWQPFETEFIDKIAQIIGSALSTLKTAETTQELLIQSQQKEEQLKSQEEEMRQNFEELIATQEEMQRKAKEAYEQHSKLSAILDSSKNSIITASEDGNIETINKATLQMFGYTEEEIINKNLKFLIPNIPFTSRKEFNLAEEDYSKVLRLKGKKKDGTQFPIELWSSEAKLEDRNLFSGIITDISERVKAEHEQNEYIQQMQAQEEELRQTMEEINATQEEVQRKAKEAFEQHSKLSAILDATSDAIITVGEDGKIENINKASRLIFGYDEDELKGKILRDIIPNIPYSNRKEFDEYKGEKGKILKLEGKRKDESTLPIEFSGGEAKLENRIIFTAIIRNITEQQKLEHEQEEYIQQMQAQEEELRQTMEEINTSQEELQNQLSKTSMLNHEMDARIAVLDEFTILSESDEYGNITFVNDKFCEVSQYTKEELIGKPHKIVRHPDTPQVFFKNLWSTIKSGKPFRGYLKNKKKDGSPYYVDIVISPVLGDDNKPIKYIAARYVIEDKKIGEKLINIQKLSMETTTEIDKK